MPRIARKDFKLYLQKIIINLLISKILQLIPFKMSALLFSSSDDNIIELNNKSDFCDQIKIFKSSEYKQYLVEEGLNLLSATICKVKVGSDFVAIELRNEDSERMISSSSEPLIDKIFNSYKERGITPERVEDKTVLFLKKDDADNIEMLFDVLEEARSPSKVPSDPSSDAPVGHDAAARGSSRK